MVQSDLRGKWALVTGASSGLGVDFSRELARRGANLILVARREERLRQLADELRREYGIEAEVTPTDLAVQGAPEAIQRLLTEKARAVDILVNNAGFGVHGEFLDNPWEPQRAMIEVDLIALVHLTRLLAADMVQRGYGRILQVASTAAYQPVPTYAVYGACKAFVLSFGEAFNYELRGSGVTCTVVSPGVTETEFQQVAGHKYTRYMRMTQMASPDVARIGIEAMLRGRSSVVPGLHNAAMVASVRLTPRRVVTALAGYFMTVRR
jgi:short-subunit dehydrogenase